MKGAAHVTIGTGNEPVVLIVNAEIRTQKELALLAKVGSWRHGRLPPLICICEQIKTGAVVCAGCSLGLVADAPPGYRARFFVLEILARERCRFRAGSKTGVSSAGTMEITCSGRNATRLPNLSRRITTGRLLTFPTK
jgi:hypothetical protein